MSLNPTKPIDMETLRVPCASGASGDCARFAWPIIGDVRLIVEAAGRENWLQLSPETADLLGDALKQWAREARMR